MQLKHKYEIVGLYTIPNSVKVKAVLKAIPGVVSVNINLEQDIVEIVMKQKIETSFFNQVLREIGNYRLVDLYVVGGNPHYPDE